MNYIIKDEPNITENIIFIYVLFLLNTVFSYFYVYKKSIIIADQKAYIVSFYNQIFHVLQVILQIGILYYTKDYILFLFIQIFFTVINNLVLAKKANNLYPFLKEKNVVPIDSNENREIFKNVKALFLYKFGSVVLNGTDNIIISSIIGITSVGLASNYLLVLNTFTSISNQVMGSFTASVGNLNAIGKSENKERVFKRIFFISAWMFGFFSVGLYLSLNDFIRVWIGTTFILSEVIVFTLVLHFYINSVHFTVYTYRSTLGLFSQGKYAPLSAAILNIILSIILGKEFGLAGVFLATSIARGLTTGLVDPILVYRIGFKKNPILYYYQYFKFAIINILMAVFINYILSFILFSGAIGLLMKVFLISILYNMIMLILFWNSEDFIDIRKIIANLINNKKKK